MCLTFLLVYFLALFMQLSFLCCLPFFHNLGVTKMIATFIFKFFFVSFMFSEGFWDSKYYRRPASIDTCILYNFFL